MISFKTGSDALQVITSGAYNLDWVVFYRVHRGQLVERLKDSGQITTATTTSILTDGSVTAINYFEVDEFHLKNRDASNSNTVTVVMYDGSNTRHITPEVTLAAGEQLSYVNGDIRVYDSTGMPKFPANFFLTDAELRASAVEVDTELPAAAALADDTANPTAPAVGAHLMVWDNVNSDWDRARSSPTNTDGLSSHNKGCLDTMANNFMYNGSTWDRVRGDTTYGIDVDVTRVTGTVTTKETRSATPSQSSVADNAASTTILASNANRLGATVTNDSSAALYLLLGSGVASTTNYTVRITQYGYYEVPFGYTGQINGIWASDPNDGAARVTELT